jgi:hypothetical protein
MKVQFSVAAAIRSTELALKSGGDRDALSFHIQRLRLFADGLAWLVLHPHVIRQLAKNDDVPKTLVDQGAAFDQVLASAKAHYRRLRVPVLIADLTSILKIGDLIVVTNTEAPMIIEVKQRLPKPEHLMQGRVGRQISRAIGTLKYLHEGSAKVYGDEHHRHVVETQFKAARN